MGAAGKGFAMTIGEEGVLYYLDNTAHRVYKIDREGILLKKFGSEGWGAIGSTVKRNNHLSTGEVWMTAPF